MRPERVASAVISTHRTTHASISAVVGRRIHHAVVGRASSHTDVVGSPVVAVATVVVADRGRAGSVFEVEVVTVRAIRSGVGNRVPHSGGCIECAKTGGG